MIERALAGRSVLAVFAHPDDESSVSAVLAKYAAAGAKVYLATATDGRLGVGPHPGTTAGDGLAATQEALEVALGAPIADDRREVAND